MTSIDTAKERAEWASIPEWEFPEAMFGLLERYHMALDALDAERAETERLRYVLDGVAAAIDTGRNEPLQIWRDQIKIARAALNPEGGE